jgi:hypothetical protein
LNRTQEEDISAGFLFGVGLIPTGRAISIIGTAFGAFDFARFLQGAPIMDFSVAAPGSKNFIDQNRTGAGTRFMESVKPFIFNFNPVVSARETTFHDPDAESPAGDGEPAHIARLALLFLSAACHCLTLSFRPCRDHIAFLLIAAGISRWFQRCRNQNRCHRPCRLRFHRHRHQPPVVRC